MKAETEGTQSINFTERGEKKNNKTPQQQNKTHNTKTYITAFKYIDNYIRRKRLKSSPYSLWVEDRGTLIRNDTDVKDDALKEEGEWKKSWPFRVHFSLIFYNLIF